MKQLFLWVVFLMVCSGIAQENFKIYYQETADGFLVVADNKEYAPVSAELNLKIANLTSSQGDKKIFVIPAQSKAYPITELTVIDRKKPIKFGFATTYNFGDHELKTYDQDYAYNLPFGTGETFWLTQGYNGSISHANEYALDFKMPIGTKIYAAREGIVVDVEESFSKRCTDQSCAKYNNYITIYHPDGTFAEYTHIKKGGAKVEVGDAISKGQFIGYSGDVGWATGPHLHFIVYTQQIKSMKTIPTKFRIGEGKEAVQLQEKEQYTRAY
ncbi:M23 family metallopeptidase [Aquimarina brevivitae]|uniref:Murein DD-endopeptidase MepM/ murein hydrolase activator NlpD n=1 Tax=Aquimarina brevivitae TaxID=323412 RepID=A0A4Q7NX08_9FLAO|nr:M23 family metallopeptidase [Aquimarina brevivitae]RZS91883.1 murein DD-endopeptidase MepM/ murein hydrolase activator NlpD [Aquimarina brevivitae]